MSRRKCKALQLTEQMPDYVSPFTAYRVWQWDADGIKSLNHAVWTPGVAFEATCPKAAGWVAPDSSLCTDEQEATRHKNQHHVPSEDCTCGMYAGINLQHLISINYAQQGIHGEVLLWGKLLKHTLGWRAQYAYPKFFIVPPDMVPFTMREIEARFQSLIAFNVDIHLQVNNEPTVGGATVPLWMKDYGWSQQGFAHLIDMRKKWYDSRPAVRSVRVGDRLAITGDKGGIGIVVGDINGGKIEGDDVFYNLFGQLHRKPLKEIRWSDRNFRWESDTYGLVYGSLDVPNLRFSRASNATVSGRFNKS